MRDSSAKAACMSLRTAAWALTVISVVAACSEGTAPSSPSQPRLPAFSYSANGTALNQANGSLREQNGNMLIKGFNPTNPHHGDAIVATFYWVGSTNIIDSVYDVMTDAQFTPVGNTYTLVDYVTAGGYAALFEALEALTPQQVIDATTASGLRGRSGAGYPTGLLSLLTILAPIRLRAWMPRAPRRFLRRRVCRV